MLAVAFDDVSRLPVLAEARARLLALAAQPNGANGEIAEAIESDAGLAIAVMRAANNGNGPSGRTAGVTAALESLTIADVGRLAEGLESYDLLSAPGSDADTYERFRRHGVAVRLAADEVAEAVRARNRDQVAIAALLHDVGRLVIARMHGPEFGAVASPGESPEERVRRERRELGMDHALVGAVLARRWGLPAAITAAIEQHHRSEAEGVAAIVRTADLIVHHARGDVVAPEAIREAAKRAGLAEDKLRALLFSFPSGRDRGRHSAEPCPLSPRELDALRGLAEGKVYKQIAADLTLSVSTVRTHLHNVYRKIGALDRAQAVLAARDHGWI